uniref:Uncharacterized protein n=1 Tax=Medicago truncatula TaxID=3880 RepID=Q2HRX2_MEDTR|nr:hypothetical protein MtrDRAFT_AC157777g31v2 [Medicago truncatula]
MTKHHLPCRYFEISTVDTYLTGNAVVVESTNGCPNITFVRFYFSCAQNNLLYHLVNFRDGRILNDDTLCMHCMKKRENKVLKVKM